MPTLLQLAQSYQNPESVNYRLAYLREQMEHQLLNLGNLAYEDQVQLAMLGETIIVGGYLRTELIAANSIVGDKIASNAIVTRHIQAGAITADKIAANSITADKIAANSITTDKIDSNSITADKIDSNAIAARHIQAGAITADKIDSNSITADKIDSNAIVTRHIQAGAITADKIDSNAIVTRHIQAGAITADKIDSNAIVTRHIQAGAITANKLDVQTLSAISANLGTVTAGILRSSNGQSYFDLNNNKIKTNNAEITGGTINIKTDSATRSNIVLSYDGGSYGEYYLKLSPNVVLTSKYIKDQNLVQSVLAGYYGVDVYEGISYDGVNVGVRKEISIESDRITIYDANGEPSWYQVFLGRNSSQLSELTNYGTLTTTHLTVSGTKNRVVKTENYGKVLHYSLETPTPLFMDVGHGVISEDGLCYVDMERIFSETVDLVSDYHVQLTKYGQGDVWVAERQSTYFVVQGTPGLKFSWEVKAKQKGYSNERLEKPEESKEGYETDYIRLADEYLINYMKELIAA